jgi:hypothetical protein
LTQAGQSKETSLAPEINEASEQAPPLAGGVTDVSPVAAAHIQKNPRFSPIVDLSPLHPRYVPQSPGDR